MYIISGPNGSGKTTASYSILPELLDCIEFVNSDEFAKHLSPFAPEAAYITASRLMLKKVQYLFDRREDFCIETTLATRALIKLTRKAQNLGYYVTVLYLWLESPDMAVARVAARVKAGGHDIPEETIRRRYRMGIQYLFDSYMQTCDKWILADNSHPPFAIIAEGSKKGFAIRDMGKYQRVKDVISSPADIHEHEFNPQELIAKELMAKAPLAHDGVPFEGTLPTPQSQNDTE